MQVFQRERQFPNAEQLTTEEKRWIVSRKNPSNPFNKTIGNSCAVEQAELIAYRVMGRINHRASDINLAWIGPPGVGKTMFARAISTIIDLPFIEIDPQSISNPNDIFNEMQRVLVKEIDHNGRTLAMRQQEDGSYYAPSCVVFIDEIHQLGSLTQALLRATEPSTHTLEGKDLRMNTEAVCWQFATTDRGLLFDAFDTRFMKIELLPYNKSDLGKIIQIHNPDIDHKDCRMIAEYYSRVTREALDAAKLTRIQLEMFGGSWKDAIEAVRIRDGIDQWGLTRKRLAVLRTLGMGKKSLSSLATAAGCKPEEMERYVLPPLMMSSPATESDEGFEPLIETGSGGRYITVAGLHELDKRGIHHKGQAALAKGVCLVEV